MTRTASDNEKPIPFDIFWTNPPRTTTREEWKAANRWLRQTWRGVMQQVECDQKLRELMILKIYEAQVYGRSSIPQDVIDLQKRLNEVPFLQRICDIV